MGKFIGFLIFSIFYLSMLGIMIVFERNKPRKIILWSIIFLFTQPLGYIAYMISRMIVNKKKNSLQIKLTEDNIYENLSNSKLLDLDIKLQGELFEFNKFAFNAVATKNNNYAFFNSYEEYKKDLISKLKSAKRIVLLELISFNKIDFVDILEVLKEKAKKEVIVKLVYEKHISNKIKKELKSSGVKVYKFSKYNTIDGIYSNLRNVVSIDGEFVYIGNLNRSNKQQKNTFDICDCLLRMEGDIVQTINLELFKDTIFASGKYIEYYQEENEIENNNIIQFVSNQYAKDLELLIIKAISSAKKSIQLQLEKFIPTESIVSLLNFAINSNIEVRLMVPLRAKDKPKFYATRAYSKELALLGANVYLYDGFIRFNSIVVDNEYVLYGNYSLDREHIATDLQNIIIIKDVNAVNHINKLFDASINNSYRINNANYMLLSEKLFRNIV